MMRLIYDSVQAEGDYAKSPDWMHHLLDAFADGVNYYLYKHPETRPLLLKRFEPWYALMFTDGSVSATSTGGVRPDEIRNFYSCGSAAAMGTPPPSRQHALSDVERMVLSDRGMLGSSGDGDSKGGSGSGKALAPADEPGTGEPGAGEPG